ncbi:fasciclin domain-containing protein [Bacteroidales bacterium OttesenSCG-928-M11]|nr:fasciclin domain-containing protein [Bacteroidales bacterium OttesenSCG-928-M11]
MKNLHQKIKNIRLLAFALPIAFCSILCFQSCFDENYGEYVTFEEYQIASFLDADPDTYSEFSALLSAAGITDLLNAYGNYTCFAPTNEAVRAYYSENDISFDKLTTDDAKKIVYSHIISKKYTTDDFPWGTIPSANMNDRYIQIAIDTTNSSSETGTIITVNKVSTILIKDQEVHNGIVHTVDKVLEVSDTQLPDIINTDESISIFAEALFATELSESLRLMINDNYTYQGTIISLSTHKTNSPLETPTSCNYGYTAFVESDEVFNAAGIYNLDDLIAYAAEVYDAIYPEDKDISDITNPKNSLNRFMAYHLVDRMQDVNEFIPASFSDYYAPNTTIYEYIETMCPNTVLEISTGNIINKRLDSGKGINIDAMASVASENGVFHKIDAILTYEDVEDKVLNKRMRVDVASFLSEMNTNKLRQDFAGYIIPNNYFKNLSYTEATQCQYIGSKGWCDHQADEFLFVGKYDFSLETFPIPPGTYEVRIGYTANSQRGVAQIYFDGEPCGIPLDMTILSTDARIGAVKDADTDDDGVENDKMMRNRGYLKGPTGVYFPSPQTPMRANAQSLRRIITTKVLDTTKSHTIRIKSVEDITSREFHLDYVEFVPSSVWDKEGRD